MGDTKEGGSRREAVARRDTGVEAAPDTPELLARPRLLTVFDGRWKRPVTAVVAGAGFGKTTLLAQSVADNRRDGLGIDVCLRLEPGDASASRFATRLMAELGLETPRLTDVGELAGLTVDACWSRAPTPICLVLDDVQLVAPESDGVAFLRRMVERLPRNTHVCLGSRSLPVIGTARLAVSGDALVLRERDLRFTDDELTEFARLRGVPADQVAASDGWPALAELLAGESGVGPADYVWEQVVCVRDVADRATLIEVAALGGADDAMATAVAGRPVVLDELLADIPFAFRSGSGRWELHEVVAEPVRGGQAPARIADIRRRGGLFAWERGERELALRLLVAAEAWDDVLALLRTAFVTLAAPEDLTTAEQWLVLLPAVLADAPECLLVQTIAMTLTDAGRAFELGAGAVAAFAARGDVDGEVAALARLGGIAYNLSDPNRFVPYVGRIAELAGTAHPWAVSLDAMCRGALLLMSGDHREAEAVLSELVADPSRDPTAGLGAYLCARAQVERGRFREAAQTIAGVSDANRERVRDGILGIEFAIAQGLGAADGVLDQLWAMAEARIDRQPMVSRRVGRCRLATTLAAMGDLDRARAQLVELEQAGPPTEATVDDELAAAAAVAVVAGSEGEATRLLARVVDRGSFFPSLEALTLFYVLRPELRGRYDALDLEGVHAQRREFAAAFVAAREGDPSALARYEWPLEAVVRWFAPAPWLIEATVMSAAAGGTPPVGLVRRIGPAQRHVLRTLSASSRPDVARTSSALMALLGPVAPGPLELRILGPLEVDVDGEPSTNAELRRERVRSLLGLLVLRRSVRRTEAASALWPELEAEPALGNLRVTLTHLLKLIEPRRERGAPSYFIDLARDQLTLRQDAALRVDVWDFEAAVAEAETFETAGAPALVLDALQRAVAQWRGDLLADVGSHGWLDFERIRLGALFVRSAIRAGELLAAGHELGEADAMARRAIAADAWNEAAYRLLASVHVDQNDRSGARRILDHLRQVLDDLGVSPEPETVALMARCARG